MKTISVRHFTYEEVRKALEEKYGPIAGVQCGGGAGYVIVECRKEEQPPEPVKENPVKEPPPF